MKTILTLCVLCFALQSDGCPDAQASKPAPKPPESGRQAMTVDGHKVGTLDKQSNGTYLLRYPNGQADKVSVNEIVVMP